MGVPETVTELLDPVVTSLGAELVDVEWTGSTLRLVVDATGGVTTDQLAKVNRMASSILDQHDPVPGRYTLEVSSPGVERNLTRPDHYLRAIGENVVVKMSPGIEPRRLKGKLVAADETELTIEADEIDGTDLKEVESHQVSLVDIGKARTVFDWGPSAKPGGKKGQGKKSQSNKKNQSNKPQSKQPSAKARTTTAAPTKEES